MESKEEHSDVESGCSSTLLRFGDVQDVKLSFRVNSEQVETSTVAVDSLFIAKCSELFPIRIAAIIGAYASEASPFIASVELNTSEDLPDHVKQAVALMNQSFSQPLGSWLGKDSSYSFRLDEAIPSERALQEEETEEKDQKTRDHRHHGARGGHGNGGAGSMRRVALTCLAAADSPELNSKNEKDIFPPLLTPFRYLFELFENAKACAGDHFLVFRSLFLSFSLSLSLSLSL